MKTERLEGGEMPCYVTADFTPQQLQELITETETRGSRTISVLFAPKNANVHLMLVPHINASRDAGFEYGGRLYVQRGELKLMPFNGTYPNIPEKDIPIVIRVLDAFLAESNIPKRLQPLLSTTRLSRKDLDGD